MSDALPTAETAFGAPPPDSAHLPTEADAFGAPTVSSSPVSDEVGNFLQKIHVAAPLEATAHAVSGAAASVPAGVASLYAMATNRSTAGGSTAKAGAQAAEGVQNALTYQPRTQEGKDLSDTTTNALGWGLGGKEGEWLRNKAIQYGSQNDPQNPGSSTPQRAAMSAAPYLDLAANIPATLLGAKLGEGSYLGKGTTPEVSAAMDAGYKLTPQQAGAGIVSRNVSAIASRPQLERELSRQNQKVTDAGARADIGMAPDTRITPATLNQAAAPHNAVYQAIDDLDRYGPVQPTPDYRQAIQDVRNDSGSGGNFAFDVSPRVTNRIQGYSQIPEFLPSEALARVKALRAEASKAQNSNAYHPDALATARTNRGIADALEDELDRHVQALSQPVLGMPFTPVDPNLLPQLRNSRVQLAKINNIRDALDGPNVDASALKRARDHGAQLTGNLATAADAAENFDRSVQVPSKIRDQEISYFDAALASGTGAAGIASGHPVLGAGMLAAMFGRPVLRLGLKNSLYQKYLRNPPQIPMAGVGAGLAGGVNQTEDTQE